MLDLNEIPCDPDDAPQEGVEPAYCTPIAPVAVHEEVGESPATIRIADNEPLIVAPIAEYNTGVAEHNTIVAEDSTGVAEHNTIVAEDSTGVAEDTTRVACEAPADAEQELEYRSQPQEPFLGMRFDTLAGAKEHYNAYARMKGFSIKSNTSRWSAFTNLVEKHQFVCNKFRKPKPIDDVAGQTSKAGIYSTKVPREESSSDEEHRAARTEETLVMKKVVRKRKRESIKQTECKAKMTAKLIDGRWEVIFFVNEHNHELITKPSLTKYLLSHKNISPEEEDFLRILDDCNLQTGQMMQLMSRFYANGFIVPYKTKTISNFRFKIRAERKGDDMAETVSYFIAKQKEDLSFYFNVKMDEEDRVELLFWVDGAARKAYTESYHDCISFDTTYLTNQYNMPFAPFIGINCHGQSFMLGYGFMRDETTSSFDWLFQQYLDAMGGQAPLNIITDQDNAMRASIVNMFPNTVLRNCRWHIMKKA
ncbi:hypothetical protein BRADI_5g11315v3 [Brachypodium distachyon]|uniref:Uncharacterized protein n=1 Tax=Brachypodium distachyon TaxID=15368 RepID=A0A0Q3E4T2_BRADI|nr:hypothetical protein BRADI_5g11315v3 [Brachypodium distachyon]